MFFKNTSFRIYIFKKKALYADLYGTVDIYLIIITYFVAWGSAEEAVAHRSAALERRRRRNCAISVLTKTFTKPASSADLYISKLKTDALNLHVFALVLDP